MSSDVDRRPVVPAYFHPAVANDAWDALRRLGSSVRFLIFNVDSGPGSTKEFELARAASRLTMPRLGYVDTDYASRSFDAIGIDIARYRQWYPTSGIFFDRVASTSRELAYTAGLVAVARKHGATTVVLNHGVYPDPEYATIADALVTFEGPEAAHRTVTAPTWVRNWPESRFWHLVYEAPAAAMAQVRQRAAACHADPVCITERNGPNPWDGLPAHLLDQVPT